MSSLLSARQICLGCLQTTQFKQFPFLADPDWLRLVHRLPLEALVQLRLMPRFCANLLSAIDKLSKGSAEPFKKSATGSVPANSTAGLVEPDKSTLMASLKQKNQYLRV